MPSSFSRGLTGALSVTLSLSLTPAALFSSLKRAVFFEEETPKIPIGTLILGWRFFSSHSSGGELPPTDLLVDWIPDPRRMPFVSTDAQERTLLRVVARRTQETAEIPTFSAAHSVGGCYTTNGC